ncbi:hypothetical protein DCAR_0934459 [Daucus carota subsp. sativus]|uniref:Uncharacterized protein n=1 Tax=Daucus carota subsp. sativus TaxID=79200 RepID=A0AAF1BCR8_DAUCS|nr:hypothetical protein DCAR_0934459 [Daucus carota subsp. sativus]
MYRHSPNRNQRSKGFKSKHALHNCVLVAVCLWLVYQVKHSNDKRKQFGEKYCKRLIEYRDEQCDFQIYSNNDHSIEDHVDDERSRNTREAREEQYKGDDASSAVTHDAQSTSTENDIGNTRNQLNILKNEKKGNCTEDVHNSTVLNSHEVEIFGNGTSGSDEEKNLEVFDLVSQINTTLASLTGFESNDQQRSSILQILMAHLTGFRRSTDSSTKSGLDNIKNVDKSDVSAESKDSSDSSVLEETSNDLKSEDQDNIKETDEVQYESTEASDPTLEDKENHIDLDTLPEIRTEGRNSEEVAED